MAAPRYSITQLIDWVNHQISHSPYNIVVTNLTTCFHDGIALCAILHSYYPTPIPFEVLSHTCKKFNVELAFREAENVGIPYSTDSQELWMTRAPDEAKVAFLVSQWRRYLEMEGDDVKADLEDKCDFLKAKFNEQGERNRGYQEALLQLKQDLASNPNLVQCHRCGDGLDKSSDTIRLTEGAPYHPDCHRCYNCSADAGPFAWYHHEIWCQACQTASEEQLGSASGSASAAELEARLLEIKQIVTVRREKANPFREMERKREEERARKLELFRQKQRERAEKLEADLRQDLAEAEEAAKAAAEEKRRQEEEAERQRQEEAERRRQEELRAREEEKRRAQQRREEEQRLRAEAVQAEAVSDFDGLKQKRGEELEEIKATRAGLNPFREMERIQAEEQKRRRFSPRTTPISERAPLPSDETKGTVRILEKTRRVTTNPFAEMERKRQQERMTRMKGFVSQSKLQVLPPDEKEPSSTPSASTDSAPTPSQSADSLPAPEAIAPAATPSTDAPAASVSPVAPTPASPEAATPAATADDELAPDTRDSGEPDLDEASFDTQGIPDELDFDLSLEDAQAGLASLTELQGSPSRVAPTPARSSEADLLEMSLEADLLLEAADTLEAQRITIQEQMTLIQEQEIILIKQKESISELQRELAALQSEMKRNRKAKA